MKNNKNMKKGFSLIELLISLIVISCITAAFTPLITKKFSSGVFGGGGSVSDISADCEKFGPNCNLCTSNICLSCTGLTCNSDEYKDNKSCTCKKCVDTYGADCTKCNEDKCLICPDGQYLDENENCKPCSNKFSNCSSCDIYQCNACKDGYILTDPTSTTPCSSFTCSSPDFMQIGDLCIAKFNMGDSPALTIPDEVNVVASGTQCTPSATNLCCWKGITSQSCDNKNGGGYSGCNRTACSWNAAEYICKNFNAGGYTWRLPYVDEMKNWDIYSKGLGTKGLQLCDYYSGYSSARCYWGGTEKCPGDACQVNLVFAELSGGVLRFGYLEYGNWIFKNYTITGYTNFISKSTRCVATMPQSCAQRISEGCLSCEGNNCLSCDTGYVLKNGKCEIDCATKFGTNCTECTQDKCKTCAEDYKLSSDPSANPACESEFTCTGENFMQIGNLCVTRRNMGDSDVLSLPNEIKTVNAWSSCSGGYCCWNGGTASGNCDNANGGGYSGCNRTVCTGYAAEYICKNYNYGGKTWRLPTISEMGNWGSYSIGKGANGLQLCNQHDGCSSAKCGDSSACKGVYYSTCAAFSVWSGSPSGGNLYYFYISLVSTGTGNNTRDVVAYSVRCVTEL